MEKTSDKKWQFNRQINASVLIELVFLATLIVGSWVNLQSRLILLRSDINRLLECQKQFQVKIEALSQASAAYEYRLRSIEKNLPKADIGNEANL